MNNHESTNVGVKLILEDLRRTADHAIDIAEATLNQTISEVIEKHTAKDNNMTALSVLTELCDHH
jgi:hypothetical protein